MKENDSKINSSEKQQEKWGIISKRIYFCWVRLSFYYAIVFCFDIHVLYIHSIKIILLISTLICHYTLPMTYSTTLWFHGFSFTHYLCITLLLYGFMVCHSYTTYELFYYFMVPWSVIHILPMNYSTTLWFHGLSFIHYLWIILLLYGSIVCHSYTTYELFYYFMVPLFAIHTLPMKYSTTLWFNCMPLIHYLWIILPYYGAMVCHSYTNYEPFYYIFGSMVCHSYTTCELFYYSMVLWSVIHKLPMDYSTTLWFYGLSFMYLRTCQMLTD